VVAAGAAAVHAQQHCQHRGGEPERVDAVADRRIPEVEQRASVERAVDHHARAVHGREQQQVVVAAEVRHRQDAEEAMLGPHAGGGAEALGVLDEVAQAVSDAARRPGGAGGEVDRHDRVVVGLARHRSP
jgi:hypothetical protein